MKVEVGVRWMVGSVWGVFGVVSGGCVCVYSGLCVFMVCLERNRKI